MSPLGTGPLEPESTPAALAGGAACDPPAAPDIPSAGPAESAGHKHPCDKPYRVGLYWNLQFAYCAVFTQHGEVVPIPSGYVRLSEMLEVRFRPLPSEDSVQEALATLDRAEQTARAELAKCLTEIADQRASLRALTYQPEAS